MSFPKGYYKHNDASKAKMREARKGKKPALGHRHSEESKDKMKEARYGKKPALGMHHTEESKEKMREKLKGRKTSEQTKQLLSDKLKGRSFSAETRAKMSAAKKGKPLSTAALEAAKLANINRVYPENERKKRSLSRIAYLEAHPEKHWRHQYDESYPESKFRIFIESCGLSQGNDYIQEFRVGSYSIDFAFLLQKIGIEIDGSQHKTEAGILHDIKRDAYLSDLGWKIFRFPVCRDYYQVCVLILKSPMILLIWKRVVENGFQTATRNTKRIRF